MGVLKGEWTKTKTEELIEDWSEEFMKNKD